MGALAPGGRAGVEHAVAGGDVERAGGKLRALILDRHQALTESRQCLDRHRVLQAQSLRGVGRGNSLDARVGEFVQ